MIEIIIGNKWYTFARRYPEDSCIDQNAYSAFLLLGVEIVINLLPGAVYAHLFVSEAETGSRHYLNEDTE